VGQSSDEVEVFLPGDGATGGEKGSKAVGDLDLPLGSRAPRSLDPRLLVVSDV
jgi:hypothetical protein